MKSASTGQRSRSPGRGPSRRRNCGGRAEQPLPADAHAQRSLLAGAVRLRGCRSCGLCRLVGHLHVRHRARPGIRLPSDRQRAGATRPWADARFGRGRPRLRCRRCPPADRRLAILVNQGIPFLQAIPGYIDQLHLQIESLDLPAWLDNTLADLSDTADKAIESANPASFVLGFLQGALSLVGTLLTFLVIPFFLFFFMRDQPKIAANFFNGIPVPWRVHVDYVVRVFKDDFADYFKAEIIVGLIMGVIISVGVFVIGLIVGAPNALMEFALLLGLIAAVLELLPTIGPILSMIPALLIAITISPFAFILVLVFYLVAFQVESSILVPLIEGKVISFGPATVLFLVALGFGLGGILGAIVALPVAAIVRDIYTYLFRNAERESLVIDSSAVEEPTG